MAHTKAAPSLFERYRALTETPGVQSLSQQRDEANARCAEAWQRCRELEACIRKLVPPGWLKDNVMEHMPGIKEARALLAKGAR